MIFGLLDIFNPLAGRLGPRTTSAQNQNRETNSRRDQLGRFRPTVLRDLRDGQKRAPPKRGEYREKQICELSFVSALRACCNEKERLVSGRQLWEISGFVHVDCDPISALA
jgi:hypothetical protein